MGFDLHENKVRSVQLTWTQRFTQRGISLLVLDFAIVFLAGCGSAIQPLPRAHSHNDYLHERPLLDALDRGFCSVEADIYLVDEQLLVAHDLQDVRTERTLETLYLEPLKQRIAAQGGSVYRHGPEFVLLVDIKSQAETTYQVLHRILEQYNEMLVTVADGIEKPGAVRVIVSGNRPRQTMKNQSIRYVGLDGRLADLDSDEPSHFMPWISDNAMSLTIWRGEGPFPLADKERFKEITRKAHAKGRKVRFWNTLDRPHVWRILQECGVNVIGTDDLDALAEYFQGRRD